MRARRRNDIEEMGNIFWITMTDLMTGLVLVFVVLFFYSFLASQNEKIQQSAAKAAVSQTLKETFEQKNINATINPTSGLVEISDLELFELNSYKLSPKGKEYLTRFAPIYLNTIFSNKLLDENIQKIIIQGHTDSQTFKGKYSEDEQYMKNMGLSMARAYEVANFMINTPYNKTHGNKLRKMIVVEGASFSDPVIVNGKEDYAKSRRVELKLVLKDTSLKDSLIPQITK